LRTIVRVVTAVVAIFFIAIGIWAMVDPQSFYEQLATYPPYNEHLFHDAGAFQIGIGTALATALFRSRDGMRVALYGASAGTVLHAVSHIIDRDLGGRPSDPLLLSLLALVTLLATAAYMAQRQR
jgi:uncharacterized membrane protein